MSKKKSKVQKKKFFSHPKNKNRVFKKQEKDPNEEASVVLRRRGKFTILPADGITEIPSCSHGPCLLFGVKENQTVVKRYFACAVYRENPEECAFKVELREDNTLGEVENPVPPPNPYAPKVKWDYGCIPKKLKTIAKDSLLLFCRECNDVFEKKHKCPSEEVKRGKLKYPSKYLEALDSQSGEAQYFFSDESLSVVMKAIQDSKADGILCIGTPRIFEALKNNKVDKKNIFMLDYDKRYAHFFPSIQFAQYSMLVDHFFDPKAEGKLQNFLAKCSTLLVVCDPPFGVVMEPLMTSLKKMIDRHSEARKGQDAKFYAAIFIPYFIGKHVLRLDNSFWMVDYRVTYENHRVFNKPNRTTVRIFTNMNKDVFNLEGVDGYKFCEMCEVHVSERNKHCYMCQKCVSMDGSQYQHCDPCMRCVKKSYRHCRKCFRCHLPQRPCNQKDQEEDHEDENIADENIAD